MNRSHTSFSSWSLYDDCPRRYEFRYIVKLADPPGRAAMRGTAMHAQGESYVKGKVKGGVHPSLNLFSKQFQELRKLKALTEEPWFVDVNWKPVKTEKKAYVVSYIDAVVPAKAEVSLIDYKSGRIYAEKHTKQGELYAVLAHAHYPKAENVHVEFWYLDQKGPRNQGRTLTWDYTVDAINFSRKRWTERFRESLAATKFPPKPEAKKCTWCPYSSVKGGPCKDSLEPIEE